MSFWKISDAACDENVIKNYIFSSARVVFCMTYSRSIDDDWLSNEWLKTNGGNCESEISNVPIQ